jgi:hypothetical protein
LTQGVEELVPATPEHATVAPDLDALGRDDHGISVALLVVLQCNVAPAVSTGSVTPTGS